MDRKEAILRIKEHMKHHGIGKYPHLKLKEALDMAIAALSQPNESLTLEQLREMDGEPVWIQNIEEPDKSQWRLCHWDRGKYLVLQGISVKGYLLEEYGESWLAYAYPPAHIDREAWEKPCNMCGGKTTLYQHTNTTKLFMNTFGKAATLVTECNACPPYADCCMKGISMNSAFRISYCPECGRPLTDEAVDMVMERLEALHENIHNG